MPDDDPGAAGGSSTTAPRSGRWRPAVATLLVALAAVVAPLAVVASWADDQIGDTDRYVETVAPLASDPAVQDAVVARITAEIVDRLDVEGVTRDALGALGERGLPPAAEATLSALTVPLANQVRDFVEEQVGRLVRSDQFEQAWIDANRRAHTQMVAVLTGEGSDTVDVRDGAVSVNLATLIETVKGRLVDRGFTLAGRIPPVDVEFTVVQSADIGRAQTAFRLLGALSSVLPWLGVALLAGGVLVARSRRRTFVVGALAVAASMIVLAGVLNLVRIVYLDAVPVDQVPPAAAASIFDAVVYFVRLSLRSVLVLFLAAAAIAWVTGPGAPPTAVRRGLGRGVDTLRHGSDSLGLDTGALGTTLHAARTQLRVGILGAALLVWVMAAHPTGRFTATVLGAALLVLLVVEVLARPPAATTTPTPD